MPFRRQPQREARRTRIRIQAWPSIRLWGLAGVSEDKAKAGEARGEAATVTGKRGHGLSVKQSLPGWLV